MELGLGKYLFKKYSLNMDFIKNKNILRPNVIIWLCLLAFTFIIQQNSVNADTIVHDSSNISESMTDFISKKGLSILSENIKIAKEVYQKEFDIYSDYSLQKYISDDMPLNNIKYTPADLVQIDSEYIVNRAWRPYLRMPAQVALQKMAEDFYKSLDKHFYLISAYRSYSDQTSLFEDWCSSIRCAKIWASEHQLWLAVDIHVATKNWYTVLWSWSTSRLNKNAYKYWFINTYKKWPKIDGKMKEVWHRRYVGVPLATELFKKDLSFAEYYKIYDIE